MSNLEKYAYLMKPGNVYLFWGYRSLHANLPVDPSYTRAPLLYHSSCAGDYIRYGSIHIHSTVTDLAKFLGLSTSVPFSKAT